MKKQGSRRRTTNNSLLLLLLIGITTVAMLLSENTTLLEIRSSSNAAFGDGGAFSFQSTMSSSSTTSTDNSSNSKKPNLILHVGPMKTGTTSIQTQLLSNKHVLKELRKDNISYSLGWMNYRVLGNLVKSCLNNFINDTHCSNEQLWQRYYTSLQKAANIAQQQQQQDSGGSSGRNASSTDSTFNQQNKDKKMNVLHSVETYSSFPNNTYTIQKLRSLLEIFHEIDIIVFYRRPLPWLKSMYKQSFKSQIYRSGSRRFLPFRNDARINNMLTYQPKSRDTLDVVNYYGTIFGFDKIHIGDGFYSEHSLETEFLCYALPNNMTHSNSCRFIQNQHKGNKNGNRGGSWANKNDNFFFDEDNLVMEAYRQGYIQNTPDLKPISRHEATIQLKKLLDRTEGIRDTLPQRCMEPNSTQYNLLWNRTVLMEHTLSRNPLSIEELRVDFENEVTRFCELDPKAIMSQTKWQIIFKSCSRFYKSTTTTSTNDNNNVIDENCSI